LPSARIFSALAGIPIEDARSKITCHAVEDGLAALERLETKLVDVPTPAGPTPREISKKVCVELPTLGGKN
jgi:hypothetical protein